MNFEPIMFKDFSSLLSSQVRTDYPTACLPASTLPVHLIVSRSVSLPASQPVSPSSGQANSQTSKPEPLVCLVVSLFPERLLLSLLTLSLQRHCAAHYHNNNSRQLSSNNDNSNNGGDEATRVKVIVALGRILHAIITIKNNANSC